MVAGIVSVGDAGALGIVANGGEWGGKEQGEDSPGSGFNLGIRTAKADKRVSKPGLGAFFHTGIAGVGFAFGFDRGFEVVEGKERVIVQAIGVVNAVHCEVDIAGVGDGDGGVVADKIMQAGTQGAEDCVFVVMGGRFVIIAPPGGKVFSDCFGFPIILEEGGDLAGIILHFRYFLSFHAVSWQGIQSASMARAYSSDWPKTVRVTVAGLDGS